MQSPPSLEDRVVRLERLLETTSLFVAAHTVQMIAQRQVLGRLLANMPSGNAQALLASLNAGADAVETEFGLQTMSDYRAEIDAIVTEMVGFTTDVPL